MIRIWKKPTKEQLAHDVVNTIERVTAFFNNKPRQDICRLGIYGHDVEIRRQHIKEDVEAVAKKIETVN